MTDPTGTDAKPPTTVLVVPAAHADDEREGPSRPTGTDATPPLTVLVVAGRRRRA